MRPKRIIGIVLLGGGLGLVGAASVAWQETAPAMSEIHTERTGLETSLDSIRADLYKTSLRFQGFQKNMDAIPDTVRRFGGNIIMDQNKLYRKKILTLEADEDRDERRLKKLAAREAELLVERRKKAVPLGVVGLVLAIAGVGTLLSARPRRVAA
jgi:hypothetical protein